MTDPVFFRNGKKKTGLVILSEDDLPLLMQWANDPKVGKFLNRRRPMSFAAERKWLTEEGPKDSEIFGIYATDKKKLIGTIGFHAINMIHRTAAFGIMIGDSSCWNQKYGTEATLLLLEYAFGTLGIEGIDLDVFVDNKGAVICYENVGFVKVGVLKKWFRNINGGKADVMIMQATPESFATSKALTKYEGSF